MSWFCKGVPSKEELKRHRRKVLRAEKHQELRKVIAYLKEHGKFTHVSPLSARYCRLHYDCTIYNFTRQQGWFSVYLNED